MKREVAILTKSSKHGGFCVAGVDLDTGEWIRLVSDDEQTHGALSRRDIAYEDRSICTPLDVVLVDVVEEAPLPHQPENYLIDSRKYWQKNGECTLSDVLDVHPAEVRPYLYGNLSPYVDGDEIDDIGYSLTLVKVSSLTISQTTNIYNKPKTKASFVYNGKWYNNMSVTDPDFYSVPNGTRFSDAYLVISLPDTPFPEDCYYKFVAQIYPQ